MRQYSRTPLCLLSALLFSASCVAGEQLAGEAESFLVQVYENESHEPIEGARLIIRDTATDATYERYTDEAGTVLLPSPLGDLEVSMFARGHLPIYTMIEAHATHAVMLTDAVTDAARDEGGIWFIRGDGAMILEPQQPLDAIDLRSRSVDVTRDTKEMSASGFGSLAQVYYDGVLPAGALVTTKASWTPKAGAPVDVYFVDAFTRQSIGKVAGEYANMENTGLVQFQAPELPATEEGIWIVAMSDLTAADTPETEDKAYCCPSGSWSCTCAVKTVTASVVNCCSAPTGATCSASATVSVSGSVSINLGSAGSISVSVAVSQTFTCTAAAKTCLAHRLSSRGCGYIQCDFWFGSNYSYCSGHGCTLNFCKKKGCRAAPATSCPSRSCSSCY